LVVVGEDGGVSGLTDVPDCDDTVVGTPRNEVGVVLGELTGSESAGVLDDSFGETRVFEGPEGEDTFFVGVEVQFAVGDCEEVLIDRVPVRTGDSTVISDVALELEQLFQLRVGPSGFFLVLLIFDLSGCEGSETPDSLLLVILDHAFLDFHLRVVSVQSVLFVVSVQVQDSVNVLQLLGQFGVVQQLDFFVTGSVLQFLDDFVQGSHFLVFQHLSFLSQLLFSFGLVSHFSIHSRVFHQFGGSIVERRLVSGVFGVLALTELGVLSKVGPFALFGLIVLSFARDLGLGMHNDVL
jgi:hypothetical protein